MQYDVNKIREDFPILARSVYGKPLVYLDNGATTQKPRCVVESITDEYYSVNANVPWSAFLVAAGNEFA